MLGGEKDLLRRQFQLIRSQRQRTLSQAVALDLLGTDLRVPRFPAHEYSFGAGTIALYHFNETAPASATFSDEAARFGLPGHPATNTNADAAVTGKFGSGIRFPGASGNGIVTIADSPDFAIAAGASFTVELFVKPVATAASGRRIVASKGLTDATGAFTGPGWCLSVEAARGFNNNVRWALSDGTAANAVEMFADLNLADGNFHHLAGILEGPLGRARLFIDGVECARAATGSLSALTSAEPIRIGQGAAGNQFAGILDELRFSSVARTAFHPALGEGDDAYRKRLGIFQRWLLPTPASILGAINDAVHINADPQSFVLAEAVRPIEPATNLVRFIPATVPVGTSIDATGNTLSKEVDVCGTAADDTAFDAAVLVMHTAANVVYTASNTMRLITRNALTQMVTLLTGQAGTLLIASAYDPAGTNLHTVGRSLTMRHTVVAPDALAVVAHRAGFDYIRNNGTSIEASVVTGEDLLVVVASSAPVPPGIDVFTGQAIQLSVDPASLPNAGQYRWTLIECGAASAHMAAHPADPATLKSPIATRPHIQLVADTPGPIAVKVEYTLNGKVHAGTRTVLMDIQNLADGASIDAAGELNRLENDVLGAPGPLVNTIYTITSPLATVDFGANPANKVMQIGLEQPLNALAAAVPAGLSVVKAFDPAATDRHRTGLAMIVLHATMTPDALGAAAHRAGFDFVRRSGTQIFCAVLQGAKFQIVNSAFAPIAAEFTIGAAFPLQTRPALPTTGTFSWSVTPESRGQASFDIPTRAVVNLTPTATGYADLTLPFLEPGTGELPYRFEITLNPTLEAANTNISKEDFDLIMNILNFFHPIGVEVVTAGIRKHVVEVEQDPLKAAPAYTFPDFRV